MALRTEGEFCLGLAQSLQGLDKVYALAADTDGIDGVQDNAGAYIDPTTLARAEALGMKTTAEGVETGNLAEQVIQDEHRRLGDIVFFEDGDIGGRLGFVFPACPQNDNRLDFKDVTLGALH